ncbi:MAG: SgcJ/EcaC family oxidoreductase [Bryobacteraceae bacterium]|nr:SgcJ/EcaC family oxidoreductase [Bryobacteraceae bacterium]
MGRILVVLITAAIALCAQAPPPNADAKSIASVMAALNKALTKPEVKDFAALFTSDGDLRIAGDVLAGPKTIAEKLAARPAWSEVTTPRIDKKSLRFVTPDVAIVDAVWVQYVIVKREQPVVLLMKKDGAAWRVSSMRVSSWCLAETQCKGCEVRADPDDRNE